MNNWSNDFISIPFKDRGRDRAGADCWGLTCIIFKERLGINLPILNDYTNTRDRKKLCQIIETEIPEWIEIPRGQEKEYDVSVFNMAGLPVHVGIVLRPNFMVHRQRGTGTTVERYDSKKWNTRIEGFFRYSKNTG